MPRLFCEAISQIAQVFTGSNTNNCIGQVQNAYLQEIISSCSNFQQFPILQSKEIQQFQSTVNSIPAQNLLAGRENSALIFFSKLNSSIFEILLPFISCFSSKIPLFDRRTNQDVQSFFLKLKTISDIKPKKLAVSGNKESGNNNTYNSSSAPCSFPQAEAETISKIALCSFLSFIHFIFKTQFKNKNNPSPQSEDSKNTEDNKDQYFFDIQLYSVLFNLINLSIQLNPSKDQIIDALKSATTILFEIFISESFKQYNIVYPPPKKILSRITTNPSQNDDQQDTQNKESQKNDQPQILTFDKEEFCSIINDILSLFITKSSLFFPGLDDILVGIVKHISSDHRSELHFFDKQILKFITQLASKIRASTFSQDAARSLILLASNQLLKFDKDSLDYFISLSKHNNDASNTQIVMMLVNSLTIELPKERITNADNCIIKLTSKINKTKNKEEEANQLKEDSLFPENEVFNDSFRQPETKRIIDLIVNKYLYANEPKNINDSTTSASYVPFVQEGYSTLVSKRIYKIICSLSESFRKSTPMLDKLYTTFGKVIANSSSLFDSLCLFVAFYLESKSKWHFEPTTNPAVFLLLQHLFSRSILAKKGTIVQTLQMFSIGILIDKGETYLLNILNEIAASYKTSNESQKEEDKSTTNDENSKPTNKANSLPTCPLFVLQILESLIVNYKKLVILLTNSSDAILEPLCSIMNEMKKISFDTDYTDYYNVSYNDLIASKSESENEFHTSMTNTPNFQREIDRVRYTFLILVSLIFENNEAKKILIDNSSFTKTFLDFVFEGEKVREYILSQLENALLTSKCNPSIALIPNITKIFESICQSNNKDQTYVNKAFILTKEILSTINQTLANRKELSKNFTICSSTILRMILYVKEESQDDAERIDDVKALTPNLSLFHELIDFLARISIHYQINEQDKEIIRSSIDSLWRPLNNNNLPKWLYYSLIKLMVPDEKLIRQPTLLHLIFHYFNNDDEYLKFLCDLIDNNSYNVDKCCSVNFDKTIFQTFISDSMNFENQTLIKKLFTKIALIAISPSVVYQYLRLFSPKNPLNLNKNMDLHLNYLNELFILSLETQHESWALNPGHSQQPVTIDLLSKMMLPKSSPKRTVSSYGNGYFTLAFWLFVEEMSPTYFPLIFSAKDEAGNIYEVFIRRRKICINSDKTYYSSSNEFNFTFNKEEWYFVSLSFSRQEENQDFCIVTMTVNDIKDNKFEVKFPANRMLTGMTTFVFGGVLHSNSLKATKPCLLGPFALFNMILRYDKIQSLYKQEQRFFCRDIKDQSLCHVYQPYAYGPRQMQKNFASTIVLNIKLEVFIPLFLLIPMKFDDGTIFKNYIEVVINIIKHGLNFGSTVEDSFYNANGFGIISFIFSQKKFQKYCDFNLYSQFYNLFLNLMTEKLKTEMIKTILLNFDLWSKNEKAEEIVQIFDNWLNALFPNNLQAISKIYSFSSLLNMIVFNFCLKEDEHLIKFQYELPQLSKSFFSINKDEDNSIKRTNLNETQRQMINDILFQILLFFSVQKFTFDDYFLLVSYLSNSQSIDLILNIKKLLLQMIILKPSPLEPIFDNNTTFSKLHQVFLNDAKYASIEAIESTIEIIIFLHKASMINGSKIIPSISLPNNSSFSSAGFISKFSFTSLKTVNLQEFSLTDHLYTIMQQIPKEIFEKREFFNRLVDLTEKASPEIFPFTCWSALCIMSSLNNNQGKEERKEMLFSIFKNIEPSHEFVTPHWSLIPILLVIKVNEKTFADKMISFLIDCCKGDQWAGIFFTITSLCKVFHVNPTKFQRIFLLKILNTAVVKKEQNGFLVDIIVQITSAYLFYRDLEYDSICKFFNESPFKQPKSNIYANANNKKKDININSNFLTFNPSTKICDFISQISQIDSNSLKTVSYFGLRFHKMSGKWIDRDIATLLLRYISNVQSNDSINFLRLVLVYFIINQNEDQKFVSSLLKQLDKPQLVSTNNSNDNQTNNSNGNNNTSTNNTSSNNTSNSNNCLVYMFNNSLENSHAKRQDFLQILVDLVCFKIEEIGLSDICPLFNSRSDNFRVNRNQFFANITLAFDDKEMLDFFFSSNLLFSKRIQEISDEILKFSTSKVPIPSFLAPYDQQIQKALLPYVDSYCMPKGDISKIFEISQMTTIVKKINDMYKYKHLFKDLFESITTSKGPLYSLNIFKKNGKYMKVKRDKTLVAQLIPLRMKTSWILDDHHDAFSTPASNPETANKAPTSVKEREASITFTQQPFNENTSKVPSLSMDGTNKQSQSIQLKSAGSRVRRISTLMKKRLMLSSSNCFVYIDTDIVKKNCELVSIDKTEDCFLTLSSSELKILKMKNFKQIRINIQDIKRVTKTTYLHKPISLQIITTNGKEFFLNLETNESRDSLYTFISTRSIHKSISFVDHIERSTRLWLDEKMTNFEYLLIINMASGRSFQNSSQYPIFPFVLNVYNREIDRNMTQLNTAFILNNTTIYRDLSKASGALDNTKYQRLKKNYNILKKVESNTPTNSLFLPSSDSKVNSKASSQPSSAFLFSTGASNPQILYGELARIEPFLSLYIALQGGRINNEANYNLMTSIPSLYEGVLNDLTDFRELSPEFYIISPEFLEKPKGDIEKEIKFGDASLPPWFDSFDLSSCFLLQAEFLYLHRKALESNFVRSNLNKWIDLVFGVLQRSEGNIYEASLYEEAWNSRAKDEKNKLSQKKKMKAKTNEMKSVFKEDELTVAKELEASKRVLGQVPIKVFNKPHPQCQVSLQNDNNNNRPNKLTNNNIEKAQEKEKEASILASSSNQSESNKLPKRITISPKKASEAEDNKYQAKQSQKFIKSRSSSLISTSAIKRFSSENSALKKEVQISIPDTKKKVFSTSETLDEKLRKKQILKMKMLRDSQFDMRRVELKELDLIYATVYSAASKSIKIHSLDKNGARFLFVVDTQSLDVIYSRSFDGELTKTTTTTSSSSAAATSNEMQQKGNELNSEMADQKAIQKDQTENSLTNSILSIASFRDCLIVALTDKTVLLDSDGKIAINGHYTDSKSGIESQMEAQADLRLKRYTKVAYDSECLVAVGSDSVIDLFKNQNGQTESLKSTASPPSFNLPQNGGASEDSSTASDGLIQNAQSLTDSAADQPNSEQTSFSFSDTLRVLHRPMRSFHFFNENEVKCMAVSMYLNTFAVASSDGNILLFSLLHGSTIVELQMPVGFVAQQIVFTKSLGLVVVYGTKKGESDDAIIHSLFVYSLNGELVRKRAIPCSKSGSSSSNNDSNNGNCTTPSASSSGIVHITSFLSKKGIDYLAVVTAKDNALHICEAFLLDFECHYPPQQTEAVNAQQSNATENGKESQSEADSPLILGQNASIENEPASDSKDKIVDEESLIKKQLETPFPSFFRFDDSLVYIGFKRKISSLLYITTGGELGLVPVNKLVNEEY